MKMSFIIGIVAIYISCMPSAEAHKSHASILNVSIVENNISLETVLEMKHLKAFDTNKDGKISKLEFDNQQKEISHWVDENINLITQSAVDFTTLFSDMPISNYSTLREDEAIKHLRILRRYKASKDALPLFISVNLFDASSRQPFLIYSDGLKHSGHITQKNQKIRLK